MYRELIVSVLLAVAFPIITYLKHSLTLAASIEAGVLVFTCGFCGKYQGLFFLITSYFIIAVVDHFVKGKSINITKNINKKYGTRDAKQVFVNGFPAFITVILSSYLEKYFFIAFIACLSEALSDSLSSDIGVLSKKNPVSIFRFKRVQNGLSGGVSPLGSFSCIIGTLFMATMFYIINFDVRGFFSIILGSVFGCFVDTFLGDLVQVKYICQKCEIITEKEIHCDMKCKKVSGLKVIDNCNVNLISNIMSGVFSLILYVWVFQVL